MLEYAASNEPGYLSQLLAWDPYTPLDAVSDLGTKAWDTIGVVGVRAGDIGVTAAESIPETAQAASDAAEAASDVAMYTALTTAVGAAAVGGVGYLAYKSGAFKAIGKMLPF